MRTEIDLQSLLAIGDRERAEEAVGIANGKCGDARGTLQRARCSVSHSLAGRNVAHLQNSSGKLDHRRKTVGAGAARLAAIKRNAGAHEIIMIGPPEQDAGGVGEARRRLRQFRAKGVEGLPLRLVLRMVGLIGAGKVAHQKRELEGTEQALCAREGGDLIGGKPEPVHAAVDMDGGRELRARGRAERGPFFDLGGAVEHRAQAQRAVDRSSVLEQTAEDVDGRVKKKRPQLCRLAERGDEESLAACPRQSRGDLCHAQAHRRRP